MWYISDLYKACVTTGIVRVGYTRGLGTDGVGFLVTGRVQIRVKKLGTGTGRLEKLCTRSPLIGVYIIGRSKLSVFAKPYASCMVDDHTVFADNRISFVYCPA